MASNTPEGLLNIPQQSKPTIGSFDTKPKQVETWVAELPMANTGESARRIYHALREMNQLAIPAQDRLKALEAFRAPVYHITGVLKKHYISQNLPLSPKNQKIAELAIELHSEMALGYKCVIDDKLSKTFSLVSSKTLTKAIHRAIRYLSNVLLCSYQIYIQHPEHVWLQIHRLYLYAEENQLHNTLIKDHIVSESFQDSSIADIYKQILLLALAGPYRLRQNVTEAVYKALEYWAREVRILPYDELHSEQYAFTINLNTDAAPGYFRGDATLNPTFCRTIDTQDLAHVVGNSLINADRLPKISEDVLRRLLLTWSGKSHRSFSRTAKNNEIAITLGLSATHHYIDEIIRPLLKDPGAGCPSATELLQASADTTDSEEDELELDSVAHYTATPVFGISNLDDHTPDVWDPDYTYRANNPNPMFDLNKDDDTLQRKASLYTPFSCKGINESAGGYCLLGYLVHGKDSQKVQIGELVGIRDNIDASSTQLSIGVIRRIKNWKDGVELGIQKLAPCAEAIATAGIPKDDSHTKYQRSLVLPELPGIGQPATLITHAWHQEGDQLIANVHGQRSQIKLSKKIESTGVFSQFQFSVLDKASTQQADNNNTQSDDEFDAVWTLT